MTKKFSAFSSGVLRASQSKEMFHMSWLLQFISIEWNLIRLGGPVHGIVTKTVHKTLPGGGGGEGV